MTAAYPKANPMPHFAMPARARVAATIAATLLGAIALLSAAPLAASAAPVPGAITGVTILAPDPAHPNHPLTVGQTFVVDATWAVPDGSVAGDTFALVFPTPVGGYIADFDLMDSTGNAVGRCLVASDRFNCTLGDYVTTHTDIHGSLHFTAVAKGAATGTYTFTSETGDVFTPAIPGGAAVVPQISPITGPVKGGAVVQNGNIQWEVIIPAERLVDGIVLTDTFSAGQTLDTSSVRVLHGLRTDFVGFSFNGASTAVTPGSAAAQYELGNSPDTSSFTVTLHAPVTSADTLYVLIYQTVPTTGTAQGAVFTNRISGAGNIAVGTSVAYVTAGGTGSGTVIVPPVTPPVTPVVPVTPPVSQPQAVVADAAIVPTLASTGADNRVPVLSASLLMLVGAALIVMARIRRRSSAPQN